MGRSSARTDAGRSEQERGAEVSTIRSGDDRRERETRPDDQRKSCHLCGKKSEREGGKMRKTNAGGWRASAWMQRLESAVWGRAEQIAGDE